MQKPLTKATDATTGRGKGEDDPPFTKSFLPMNERADKLSDHANQWNDVRVLEAHEPTDAGQALAAKSEDTEKSGLGHALILLGIQCCLNLAQFQQGIHQVGMFQRQLHDMVLQLLKLRSCNEGHG